MIFIKLEDLGKSFMLCKKYIQIKRVVEELMFLRGLTCGLTFHFSKGRTGGINKNTRNNTARTYMVRAYVTKFTMTFWKITANTTLAGSHKINTKTEK